MNVKPDRFGRHCIGERPAAGPGGTAGGGAPHGSDRPGLATARRPAPHRQRPVSARATPAPCPPSFPGAAPVPVLPLPAPSPLTLCVVGAGPTAIGILERLVANAAALSDGRRLAVHLVDPHPP